MSAPSARYRHVLAYPETPSPIVSLPPTKGGYLMDTSDPVARTDQELARLASVLGAHFRTLVEVEGFQRCEALELCRDLQGEMLGGDDD